MKWEHKIGIAITCTFLCLIGAVIGLKMQEPTPAASPKVAAADSVEPAPAMQETKIQIPLDNLEMPPPEPPSPAPRGNTSDGVLPQKMGTRETALSGKNATQSVKGGAPTQSGGKKDTAIVSASSPLQIEPKPTSPLVEGAKEWGTSSNGSKENKQNAAPAAPPIGTNTGSPSPPPTPEAKKPQPANQPAPSVIVPASNMEPALAMPEPQIKPVATSPSPPAAPPSTPPGTGSPPTPPALGNATNSASPSVMPAMPSYLSQQPTNAPKAHDTKDKGSIPPSPIPPPVKTPEMPAPLAPPAQVPAPVVNPAIVPTTPASPAPLPAPTAPPPSAPMPSPIVLPGPTSTPAPSSPAPSPPKPPADGSSFIPDKPPAATGPVGVKPAPFPFPAPPPSPPRTASNGPSVTVYDEQDYSCRPGETWEEISKHFYMTDRYAKALQRHNQNHARASDRMKANGQLAPGERIFVPQAYVLEERYADAIPKPAAAPAATTVPVVYPSSSPPPAPPAPPPNP